MRLNEDESRQLDEIETFLSREIRSCGFAHEDLPRDENGIPIANDNDKFVLVPECRKDTQHFGCPHLFENEISVAWQKLNKLLESKGLQTLSEIRKHDLEKQLVDIDDNVRNARMLGIFKRFRSEKASELLPLLPSYEQGQKGAAPYLQRYEKLLPALTQIKSELIEKIHELRAL